MLTIFAATRNPAKVAELSRLLAGVARVAPAPHDISLELEERGDIEANARLKAVTWSRALASDRCVIATDGGLLVPGLGSAWEPTRTRRFAGTVANDIDRVSRLLAMASHLVGFDRAVGWRESVAIACNGEVLCSLTAESDPGLLATDVNRNLVMAGNGFWIPAIWQCPEYDGRLLAELSETERERRVDHWTRLRPMIESWVHNEACLKRSH